MQISWSYVPNIAISVYEQYHRPGICVYTYRAQHDIGSLLGLQLFLGGPDPVHLPGHGPSPVTAVKLHVRDRRCQQHQPESPYIVSSGSRYLKIKDFGL